MLASIGVTEILTNGSSAGVVLRFREGRSVSFSMDDTFSGRVHGRSSCRIG